MLTSEEKAALDRVRRAAAGESYSRIYGSEFTFHSLLSQDERRLASAYLRDHPPDDDTPLDEEFLRGLGWDATDSEFTTQFGDRTVLVLDRDGMLFVSQGPDSSIEWPVTIRTRGQLRDLLAVLGEGKEGE